MDLALKEDGEHGRFLGALGHALDCIEWWSRRRGGRQRDRPHAIVSRVTVRHIERFEKLMSRTEVLALPFLVRDRTNDVGDRLPVAAGDGLKKLEEASDGGHELYVARRSPAVICQ